MHVGLNLIYLTPGATGGTEVYARELIPELVAAGSEHRFTAFVNRDAVHQPGPWSDLIDSVEVPVRALNRAEWVRGEQQLLPRLAARAGIELMHSLANTAPAWGRFRRVVTVHDLIYQVVPESRQGLRSLGMRLLVPLAARRSDRVIVDASATRADLHRLVRVPESRIDVVPLGFGNSRRVVPTPEAQLRRSLRAGERSIVLSVSAKLAHKNLIRLVEALASVPAGDRPLLVMPGYPTPHEAEIRDRVAQLGLDEDVRLLDWVSSEDLEGLYDAASAFIFPSLYEGFGLPVLEAMARGVPVACSNGGALAEVTDGAAFHFDPRSPAAIGSAIRRLLEDRPEAERLARAGRQRAEAFSWKATAAGTLAAYRRALPPGGTR